MKKLFVLLLVFGILLFGCAQATVTPPAPAPQPTPQPTPAPPSAQPNPTPNPEPAPQPPTTQPPASAGEVKEFKLTVAHTGYTPNKITVNKGDMVKILVNTGPGQTWHNHGVTVDEYSINTAVRSEDANAPVAIEFKADKEGAFKIYCKTCNDAENSWKAQTGSDHPPIQATLEVK